MRWKCLYITLLCAYLTHRCQIKTYEIKLRKKKNLCGRPTKRDNPVPVDSRASDRETTVLLLCWHRHRQGLAKMVVLSHLKYITMSSS